MNKLVIQNPEELKKFLRNVVVFTAPVVAIFFFQLSQGVKIKEAGLLALYALYALLSDYFKKLNK